MNSDGNKDDAPLSKEEAVALIEAELLKAAAERMLEDRKRFRNAHGPIDRQVIRNLIRRP
jgi:hypothetical protein